MNIDVQWTTKYLSLDYRNLGGGVTQDKMRLVNNYGLSYQAVGQTLVQLFDISKYQQSHFMGKCFT